jgi:DNA-binding response OmpR family regulator
VSKTSILVIDTDASTRNLVSDNIEAHRADVVVVTDMKEGLAFVKRRLPALIVVNADLPKGWRLCTEFKKHARFAPIPLVIISAQASQEVFYQHQGLPTRADAYLHKPLDGDTLSMTFLGLLDYSLGDPFEADQLADDSEMIEFDLFEDDGVEVEVETPGPPPLDEASSDALKARISELEGQLRTQRQTEEERLKAQAQVGFARLQELQRELAEARAEVERLGQSVAEASASAADAGESAAKAAELQARLDELVETSRGLEQARAAEAQELAELRQLKEALETERDAMGGKAKAESAELHRQLEEAQARASTAMTRAAEAETELGEVQGRVEALTKELAAKAEGADAHVTALEEANTALLQDKADALKAKADLLGRVQALEDDKTELSERASKAEAACNELADTLTEVETSLADKLKAAADELEDKLKAAEAGLEDQLKVAAGDSAAAVEAAQAERAQAVARAEEAEGKLEAAEAAAAEASKRAEAADKANRESMTRAVDAEGERDRAHHALEKAQGELLAAQQYEAALAEHIATVERAYAAAAEASASTGMGLREALAMYQMREGALLAYKDRADGMRDTLKAVAASLVDALGEHGGDEEIALPEAPDGVPAPVTFESLPAPPKRQAPPRPTGKVSVADLAPPPAATVDADEVLIEEAAPPPPPPPPGEDNRLPDDPDIFAGEDEIADIQPFVPE